MIILKAIINVYQKPKNEKSISTYWIACFILVILSLQISSVTSNPIANNLYLPNIYSWGYFQKSLPQTDLINGFHLFIASQLVAAVLFWQKQYTIVLAILIALIFAIVNITWNLDLWTSENLWDYLIDSMQLIMLYKLWRGKS